jgi:ankyrin repeat protein
LQQLLAGTNFSDTCAIFSMWYSFYRLLYPSLSSEEVYRQMNDRLERSTNKTETIKMIIQTFLSLIKINIDDHTVSGERKMGKTSQYKIKKIRGIVEPETEDNIERFLTGDIATMEKMMEDGMITNINVQVKNGYTALMAQTLYGEIAEMEWLLKKKANVDLQGSDGMSAIFLAIYNGDLHKVQLLLRYNANLKIMEKSGDTPLTYAMKIKDAMKIKENKIILMLEEAIQKGEPDSEYNIEKFIIGDLKTMKEMLESGRITNVDVKGGKYLSGYTALIHKASNGNIAELEWLLEHGANVDLQALGRSAIFFAINHNDVDMVKLLLKFNPNLNIENRSGHTPLTYAKMTKRKKIIPILEAAMKS